MTKGFLYVESRPSAPEREIEYNDWYDRVHLSEVLAIDGFVSATRMTPVHDGGAYVALYQLKCADLEEVFARLKRVARQGQFRMSDAIAMDPPPTVRLLKVISERTDDSAGFRTAHPQE